MEPKVLNHVFLFFMLMIVVNEGRFVCRSCQYQANMKVTECVDNAENMTEPQNRVKCPYRCMTNSRFNKETMKATFVFRGCMTEGDVRKNECVEGEFELHCFTSCSGHFCNVDSGLPLGCTNVQPITWLVTSCAIMLSFFQRWYI